jgi:small subunit ribosomal protein S21
MAVNVCVTAGPKDPFEKTFRRFRNACERAGIVKECRKHDFFEKPSTKKNRRNQELKRAKINAKRRDEHQNMLNKRAAGMKGGVVVNVSE